MRTRAERRNRVRASRMYYWACAIEKESRRPIVFGPFDSDQEANQWGFERVKDGDFKVYQFQTRDKTAARDMFKYEVFNESGQLADVLRRARYKVTQ